MDKRKKALIKIKARMNEAVLNVYSRNYIPIVNMALVAGVCAQHAAMINAIKNNSMRNA